MVRTILVATAACLVVLLVGQRLWVMAYWETHPVEYMKEQLLAKGMRPRWTVDMAALADQQAKEKKQAAEMVNQLLGAFPGMLSNVSHPASK